MSGIITAAQVEAAASEGRRQLSVADGTIVSPLAKDRAEALGVTFSGAAIGSRVGPAGPIAPCSEASTPRPTRRGDRLEVGRLALESKIRIIARRALLREGHGLGQLEDLVVAVMSRLSPKEQPGSGCGCDGPR